jgi:hypothetical protein
VRAFSAGSACLSDRRMLRVNEACNLFILDKGKPAARPGRKAKGRRTTSGGSLAAERVKTFASVNDGEEVLVLQHRDPEGERQAGVGPKRVGVSPDGTQYWCVFPPIRRTATPGGTEEYP